jgi:chromosome segregation ATPase
VINVGDNTYRFLGKLPLRKADRWHLGIALSAVATMILFGIVSSNQSQSYAPATNTSSSYTSPSGQTSDSSDSAPISQNPQLSELKARIDSGRARLASLETQLQPVIDEIKSLDAQKDTLNAELKSLDEQQKAGIQIDIDDFNAKVKTYNALLVKKRALIAANRSDLNTHDDLVDQDSALVKQYNALLK